MIILDSWIFICLILYLLTYEFLFSSLYFSQWLISSNEFKITWGRDFYWTYITNLVCSRLLVQFSRSVMSNSLQPHGLQHARPPCPSPTSRVYPNSCPLSWWCHPTISSCHPLLLLPSIFPNIRVFSNESALRIKWPKYWSFSFNISPSNKYSVLISFRIDSFDLLAVQGTLRSLLQHHNSKASILWCSAFFMIQFSPPYMKNHSWKGYWEIPKSFLPPQFQARG